MTVSGVSRGGRACGCRDRPAPTPGQGDDRVLLPVQQRVQHLTGHRPGRERHQGRDHCPGMSATAASRAWLIPSQRAAARSGTLTGGVIDQCQQPCLNRTSDTRRDRSGVQSHPSFPSIRCGPHRLLGDRALQPLDPLLGLLTPPAQDVPGGPVPPELAPRARQPSQSDRSRRSSNGRSVLLGDLTLSRRGRQHRGEHLVLLETAPTAYAASSPRRTGRTGRRSLLLTHLKHSLAGSNSTKSEWGIRTGYWSANSDAQRRPRGDPATNGPSPTAATSRRIHENHHRNVTKR